MICRDVPLLLHHMSRKKWRISSPLLGSKIWTRAATAVIASHSPYFGPDSDVDSPAPAVPRSAAAGPLAKLSTRSRRLIIYESHVNHIWISGNSVVTTCNNTVTQTQPSESSWIQLRDVWTGTAPRRKIFSMSFEGLQHAEVPDKWRNQAKHKP